MKKIVIILIALFLISGCIKEKIVETPIGCEPPRILSNGDCCIDADESGVCDMVEEALKRTEQIKAEKAEEKIADQCIDISQWVTCEDLEISYDKLLQSGSIKIQLKNNREGIVVIKKFMFPEFPSCDKELSWNRDLTGMYPAKSSKYIIECDALASIDVLETTIEMDTNFYEKIQGLDPSLPDKYSVETEQIIKGTIKGST